MILRTLHVCLYEDPANAKAALIFILYGIETWYFNLNIFMYVSVYV